MRTGLVSLSLAGALSGCYQGADAASGGGADSAADGGSGADDGGSGGPIPAGCEADDLLDPGPVHLRRLTHREYAATVHDLLGVDVGDRVATFPADVVTGAFDNDSLNQTISVLLGERYLDSAKALATEVIGDDDLRASVVGCEPGTEACLREFVARFGRRAFRRPLEDAEVEELVEIGLSQSDPDQQVAIVLEAILMSPRFLFRVEIGTVDPEHPERAQLGGYEIATRLSYFLWGTTPDDALLDAAAAGELDSAEGVADRARAMLGDARVRDAMAEFGAQWFRLHTIAGQMRDATSYPEFSDASKSAMVAELDLLLADAMFGDGADLLELYRTRRFYVDDTLAAIYGVSPPGSDTPVATDMPEGGERAGLFTTAAFATASSRADETSPVQRAVYVRKYALCDTPPPPPPNVPSIEPEDGESTQDAFQRHIDQGESCAACHLQLDPIGFGLERYDSIGRIRSEYGSGDPVKLEGTITIDGTERSFAGGVELGELVAASDQAASCAVDQTFRWAMGRIDDPSDACARDRIEALFVEAGNSFPDLLVALTRSDAFRYRRIEP